MNINNLLSSNIFSSSYWNQNKSSAETTEEKTPEEILSSLKKPSLADFLNKDKNSSGVNNILSDFLTAYREGKVTDDDITNLLSKVTNQNISSSSTNIDTFV